MNKVLFVVNVAVYVFICYFRIFRGYLVRCTFSFQVNRLVRYASSAFRIA